MPAALTDLPNEVIFQILLYVPPSSAPALQQISRRFNDLSQPLLWRHHCRTQYRYWSQEHSIQQKFSDNAAKADWKKIFARRHLIDRTTGHKLDSILASQVGRIEKSESIVGLGYDAKDALLRHLTIEEGAKDVLARRYYSDAVLGYLHRTMAIEEWVKLKDGHPIPLERALAAFDMFVLHDREGDIDEVSARLDCIAHSILTEIPQIPDQPPRQKALTIVAYMRDQNLTGIPTMAQYQDLQNNFIGIALQDENHPSLPLISVAIYCCVARRLGLDAHPCAFPHHVIAIIKPPKNQDMDGRDISKSGEGEPLFMDPFRSKNETPVGFLRAQLSAMGVASSEHATLLGASSTVDIVRRTARNILESVRSVPRLHDRHLTRDPTSPETDSAFYGALWALLLLHDSDASVQRGRYFPYIVEHLQKQFFMDVALIEAHVLPLFQNQYHYGQLCDFIRVMRASDIMPKTAKRRIGKAAKEVRYHVGQVFKHKRYRYQAIITGWDLECKETEAWMSRMGIADLERGRHQSFYQVLVEDSTVRYVAEENIEIVQLEVKHDLMVLAGRYFKRWDRPSSCFVSNIMDEYPDD